jgi:hypothetical protein
MTVQPLGSPAAVVIPSLADAAAVEQRLRPQADLAKRY